MVVLKLLKHLQSAFLVLHIVAATCCCCAYAQLTTLEDDAPEADVLLNDESYGEDGADDSSNLVKVSKLTEAEIRASYLVKESDPTMLPAFEAPKLPDLSAYNYSNISKKINRSRKGVAFLGTLVGEPGFKALTNKFSVGLETFAKLQGGALKAIIIRDGLVTPGEIARSIPREFFEEVSAGTYISRLPILVRHGSTLLIDKTTKELRLGIEKGALLAVEGQLALLDSTIIGWSEARRSPAELKDPKQYRPFIVCWGGSQLYVARSRIAHLGYAAPKAYGLSLSHYSKTQMQSKVWPRPTGWIVESTIEDLWYGLYTWEADDVVMHSNIMRNNILYGFDPHDRSRRLIIANNDVYGTKVKHGIIISREVSDSWIFGNRTHDNHKAGIVLDRQCSGNVIANNIATKNGSDGIVISESSKNLVWNNVLSGNINHGIRIRNSTDVQVRDNVSLANGLTGIYGASVDLTGTARNFVTDPYQKELGITVVGGQYTSNGSGPFGIDLPTKVIYFNVDLRTPQRDLGFRLGGMLHTFQVEFLDIVLNKKKVAVLETK
ncbi:MAG: right-handed parallel beta-helix repeat-containing protein [Nevskia sp.]|nr:right-handed parallel beta-helix repeat-containing protein [Nevskia sp.]